MGIFLLRHISGSFYFIDIIADKRIFYIIYQVFFFFFFVLIGEQLM
jgi:hypothetical protein